METTLTRNEKIFIAMGTLAVVSFLVAFSKVNRIPKNQSQYETSEVINYRMARAEQGFSGYSLDGREIEDQYFGIKAKVKIQIPAAKLNTKALSKKNKQVAQNQAVKNSPAVNAVQEKSKTTAVSNSEFSNKAQSAKTASSVQQHNSQVNTNNNSSPPSTDAGNEARNEARNETTDKKTKEKKSYATWRQEIFAKPTKETLTAFITAYRQNEVTATEFQAMSQDLLDQNDLNLKGLGLMALRSQPSLASLSQLVHVQEQVPASLQPYIDQAYLSYLQTQNLGYLNQALQTQDKKLILVSLSLLNANISKLKNGDVSAFIDGRHLRDSESVAALSVSGFKRLLPSLAQIGAAQEPELSPLANQVAALIQTTQVAGL